MLDIATQIELHAVEGIRQCFENGIDPNQFFQGKPLFEQLTSEYTRSPRFSNCVKAFVDFGLQFKDQALLAVLLNDSERLETLIEHDLNLVHQTYTLRCAYTPLENATLMHFCAEFNHVSCAQVLYKYKADLNALAGTDEYGFGGQTPVFHTVNQNGNQSLEMMQFLLSKNISLDITVKGIVWGKGYSWETLIPSVNPISYAMMGVLPQMHRSEVDTNETVRLLMLAKYDIRYPVRNIPNKYLHS